MELFYNEISGKKKIATATMENGQQKDVTVVQLQKRGTRGERERTRLYCTSNHIQTR